MLYKMWKPRVMCLNLFADICKLCVAMHSFVLKNNIIIAMMLACQFRHTVLIPGSP